MTDARAFLTKTLGPGLLFAGAAVGVSHLVQSTRAGAAFGLGMLLVIIAANVIKYPAFSFGPRYAAATGTSLLEGYRRQGQWALLLYALLTFGTMFTVQAAVTLVTAALAAALFRLETSPLLLSAGLIAACAGLLAIGRYRWLDRIVKVVVAVLTVLTVVATVLVLPRIDWSFGALFLSGDQLNLKTAMFVAALAGWMPSAIDVAVWHSLWTLAKRRDTSHAPSVRESMLDFNIGYFGTATLAICFMLLGAGLWHQTGEAIPRGAVGFAGKVIALYTTTLGEWSRYLIGGCALMVMFSTTLTVVDGFPRALSALVERFRGAEQAGSTEDTKLGRWVYWAALAVLAVGSLLVIEIFVPKRFATLVDIATTISFCTAPLLAILNHRAIGGDEVPEGLRPSAAMRWFSLICIVILSVFAGLWIYLRFVA